MLPLPLPFAALDFMLDCDCDCDDDDGGDFEESGVAILTVMDEMICWLS